MLYIFEKMSGLKINFEKSEVILVGVIITWLLAMLRSLIVKLVYSL
jgi:hypothetical protein